MSVQLHAKAALHLGNKHLPVPALRQPVHTRQKPGQAPSRFESWAEETNLSAFPGSKPRSSGRPAKYQSLVLYMICNSPKMKSCGKVRPLQSFRRLAYKYALNTHLPSHSTVHVQRSTPTVTEDTKEIYVLNLFRELVTAGYPFITATITLHSKRVKQHSSTI